MATKKIKSKALSEEEIAALEAQIKARKRELLNSVITALAAPGALNDLDAASTLLDVSQRQEEALNRVSATIGAIMFQRAREVKEKQRKTAKEGKEAK